MTENSVIQTGNTFRIYDSSVIPHDDLPKGTYKVAYNQFTGHSLEKVEDLTAAEGKVYGNHQDRLDRIMNAYDNTTRSLGVILSGDKGMGKSLMLRLISERASNDLNIPIVMVDSNSPGLADFLDTLGEAVIVFDEFEKNFPKPQIGRGDTENAPSSQDQFLGLFDGISTTRRVYIISANKISDLSDYLLNRPGRFHYHIRFDYPDADAVTEYLNDQVPGISEAEVETVVAFSQRVKINYDHLRAVAFELRLGGKFEDVIGDLNIKSIESPRYNISIHFTDGTVVVDPNEYVGIGDARATTNSGVNVRVYGEPRWMRYSFNGANVLFVDGKYVVAGQDVTIGDPDEDADELADWEKALKGTPTESIPADAAQISHLSLELIRQNSYAY